MHVLALLLVGLSLGTVRFSDIANAVGIVNEELASGVCWGDMDNDGDVDLYLPNNQLLIFLGAKNKLYRNDGGSFTDVAGSLGVDDDGTGFGCAWGDANNDDLPELAAIRGVLSLVPQEHLLYRNNGSTPWALLSGAELPADGGVGRSVAWADYDNDGFLDLYITNGLENLPIGPSISGALLRNRGDGTFDNVTVSAGLEDTRNGQAACWGDYDDDGYLDLFVVNHGFPDFGQFESNALYHNQRDGSFVDITDTSGVGDERGGFGCAWGDYDNDGLADLYVTNGLDVIFSDPSPNLLYRNLGTGAFEERGAAAGVDSDQGSYSPVWGDFDNDGVLDLFLTTGRAFLGAPTDLLYRGLGDGSFEEIAASAGVDSGQFNQASAVADYDADGGLDIYVVSIENDDKLYRNDSDRGNWIELRLRATTANRSAIGARIEVDAFGQTLSRTVSGGSGFMAQNSPIVHVGLGDATLVRVTVRWPGPDFCVQDLGFVSVGSLVEVTEECFSVLRNEVFSPVADSFPLPRYRPLGSGSTFSDPEPVLSAGTPSYFYQVDRPGVTLRVIKFGPSLLLSF